jgi:hypothetical protein
MTLWSQLWEPIVLGIPTIILLLLIQQQDDD